MKFGIAILSLIAILVPCAAQTSNSPRQTAASLEQAGKFPEAEAAWREVLKTRPTAEAYAHLGFLEARQDHYKEAIPLYRKALALNPTMPGLRMNFGLALFKGGELKEAIQAFQHVQKTQPEEAPRLKTLIGIAYYGLNDYTAAIPYLKEVTAGDPQNLPFRLMLAHSCLGAKQYQCVLDVYHEILLLNAESAEADMLAGEALDDMKDKPGATQQFRAAVKANPQEPNVHFGLGYLLWGQSQYEEAAQEFEAELTNDPNHAQALTYLADADLKLNRSVAALPLLRKAVQINPTMPLPHLDLGILDADAGHRDEALKEMTTAAKLNPNDVNVHWRLGRLYKSMGRNEEAAAEFAKTKNLTKAANDSVTARLQEAHEKSKQPAN
ncbi:MAG TPA: tetratricopeptide repeat protein [Terriglobales bacterium]|nr:tetratricopeptide repeat protein [Terriglobales bacterium]